MEIKVLSLLVGASIAISVGAHSPKPGELSYKPLANGVLSPAASADNAIGGMDEAASLESETSYIPATIPPMATLGGEADTVCARCYESGPPKSVKHDFPNGADPCEFSGGGYVCRECVLGQPETGHANCHDEPASGACASESGHGLCDTHSLAMAVESSLAESTDTEMAASLRQVLASSGQVHLISHRSAVQLNDCQGTIRAHWRIPESVTNFIVASQ